jgi:hypothetical protein
MAHNYTDHFNQEEADIHPEDFGQPEHQLGGDALLDPGNCNLDSL